MMFHRLTAMSLAVLLSLVLLAPGLQAQLFEADFAPSKGLEEGGTRFISGAMEAQNPAVEGAQLYTQLSGFSITGLDLVCDFQGSQGIPECHEGDLEIVVIDGGSIILNFWQPVAVDLEAGHAFTFFADASSMAGEQDLPVVLANSSFSLLTDGGVHVHGIPEVPDPVAAGGVDDSADSGSDGGSGDGDNTDDDNGTSGGDNGTDGGNNTGGGDDQSTGDDGGDGNNTGSDGGDGNSTDDAPALPTIEDFGLLMTFSDNTHMEVRDSNGTVASVQGEERILGFQGRPTIAPFSARLAAVPLGAGASYSYKAADDDAAAEGISIDEMFNAFSSLGGGQDGSGEQGPGDGLGDVEPLMKALLNGAVLGFPTEGGSSDDFLLVRFSQMTVAHDGESMHWEGDAPLQIQGTQVQGAPSTLLMMPTWTWILWLVAIGLFIARVVVKPQQGHTVTHETEVPVDDAGTADAGGASDGAPGAEGAGDDPTGAGEAGADADRPEKDAEIGSPPPAAKTPRRTETVTHEEQVPPSLEQFRWVGRVTAPIALLVMFWLWDKQVNSLLGVSMMDADLSTTGMLVLSLIQVGSLVLVFTAIAWPLGMIGRNGLLLARQGRAPGPYTIAILVSAFLGSSILLGFIDTVIASVAERISQGG